MKKLNIKNAVVTGATGAIGTALIKELINRNIKVLVLTRKDSHRNENIPNSNLVKIKYCSLNELKDIKNDLCIEYDVFYHLAWAGTFGEDRNNKSLQEKNINYAIDAMECAKRFGCKKFVGIGSQAEYGRLKTLIRSDTPTNPETEYGKAKLKTSLLLKEKSKNMNISFNWIRVLSVYGPNDGKNSLISYSIDKLLNNDNLEVTKCEQIWDYLYSDDAAEAIFTISQYGENEKTYVLGSGKARRLSEYLEEMKAILNSKSKIEYGKRDYSNNQVMYLCADISDLKELNWKPKTCFSSGIINIVNNIRKD